MRKQITLRVPGLRILADVFMPVFLLCLAFNMTGLPAWVRILIGAAGGCWGGATLLLLRMAFRGMQERRHAAGVHSDGEKLHGVTVYAVVGKTGVIAVESQGCVELTRAQKRAVLRCIADHASTAADEMVEAA